MAKQILWWRLFRGRTANLFRLPAFVVRAGRAAAAAAAAAAAVPAAVDTSLLLLLLRFELVLLAVFLLR